MYSRRISGTVVQQAARITTVCICTLTPLSCMAKTSGLKIGRLVGTQVSHAAHLREFSLWACASTRLRARCGDVFARSAPDPPEPLVLALALLYRTSKYGLPHFKICLTVLQNMAWLLLSIWGFGDAIGAASPPPPFRIYFVVRTSTLWFQLHGVCWSCAFVVACVLCVNTISPHYFPTTNT